MKDKKPKGKWEKGIWVTAKEQDITIKAKDYQELIQIKEYIKKIKDKRLEVRALQSKIKSIAQQEAQIEKELFKIV